MKFFGQRNIKLKKTWTTCIILCFLPIGIVQCSEPNRPHIIFILADDLGWNDVSFHGSKEIPTPNIDLMAEDGIILHNYYTAPMCTPSRGSLMTGKYPIRLGLQHLVIHTPGPWGLNVSEKILPQYLNDLGYVSHGVGKWHLGFAEKEYTPTHRGFKSFFGYWSGDEDYFTHFADYDGLSGLDFHLNDENAWGYDGKYSTDLFTERASEIIKNHDTSQPLFLYVSHQAVHAGEDHSPLQAPDKYVKPFAYIKNEEKRTYAGMLSALDSSVGDIIAALEESNMLNNSLIIFSTDNGGAVYPIHRTPGSNWPLRGSKGTLWEGGIRGVAWIWSAQLRRKQRIDSNLFHISDWLPTLYAAAGGNLTELEDIDGVNQWPTLSRGERSPRKDILHNIDDEWKVEGVRKGDYKLLRGSNLNGELDGWFDQQGRIPNSEDEQEYDDEEKTEGRNENYAARTRARVTTILQQTYHKRFFDAGFSLPVVCWKKPLNASTNCQPLKSACLFNIANDPCEYHNIAHILPEVVAELKDLLDHYRKLAVPIRNLPDDPHANPKYHGNAWISWKSRGGLRNSPNFFLNALLLIFFVFGPCMQF